jgi:predicted RecB family nuclease
MSGKINLEVLDSHLHCKTKGYLKLAGERGEPSAYGALLSERTGQVRAQASEKMLAIAEEGEVLRGVLLTPAVLKRQAAYLMEVKVEDEDLALSFDGLRKLTGASKLGDFHYAPVLCQGGEKVQPEDRLLLAVLALVVGTLQGRVPDVGFLFRGRECRCVRVKLTARLLDRAKWVLRELREQRQEGRTPRLLLNDHCPACEFHRRCTEQAKKQDELSLLRGLTEKELRSYARKGIFTVAQLAHTFRPRRKGKRAKARRDKHNHALQALAVRDNRTYVFGAPQLPDGKVRVYLDLEGKPEEGFVYLVGVIIVEGGSETRHSFWADSKDQEPSLFEQLLEVLRPLEDFRLYCYSGYEKQFLKRLSKQGTSKTLAERVLERTVNVLAVIWAHVYFPVHSNGLKEVGRHLGCSWSEPDASGLQSLVWRARWEQTGDEALKDKLLRYNQEDCAALKRVTEALFAITAPASPGAGQAQPGQPQTPAVARVEDIDRLAYPVKWGPINFVHPDFGFVNRCSYFDYQRQHVFARTSPALRKAKARSKRGGNRKLRVSRRVLLESTSCPHCRSEDVGQLARGERGSSPQVKRTFDLALTPGGIRRVVTEVRARPCRCFSCQHVFFPERYERLDRYGHGLKAWAMHLHAAHRLSFAVLGELLSEHFGIKVFDRDALLFKALLARFYTPTSQTLLNALLAGPVLHIDETEVKLRTGKQYVWVLASVETVVYIRRPNREGAWMQELLKDFKGVLVSDFYTAYDSIPCPQQKCLIHLLRDMNHLLLGHPFDEELNSLTGAFGKVLRALVSTADEHGLKKRHLERHRREVADFLGSMDREEPYRSEPAEELRQRLLRYKGKLFTFIEHDGVAWNNNLAENAIKRFAYYREETVGNLTERGLDEYLVLLSIAHTCKYRGLSFLRFLRSRCLDLNLFAQGKWKRPRPGAVDVYPEGFVHPSLNGRFSGQPQKPKDGKSGDIPGHPRGLGEDHPGLPTRNE